MRKVLFLFLSAMLPYMVQAQNITASRAEEIAGQFFRQDAETKSSRSDLQLVWTGEDAVTKDIGRPAPFYVFSRGEGLGFVIISGMQEDSPVLAYSRTGTFVAENMPGNVRAWIKTLAQRQKVGYPSDGTMNLDMTGEVDLQTPDYNQEPPYNSFCPELIEGWRAYPGCAITAAAIVMGYYRWPSEGHGIIPSFNSTAGIQGPIELGHSYDWNDINDISLLMYELGVMARANYDYTGTAASLQTITRELPKYYDYNPRMKYLSREKFSIKEWKNMLHESIGNKQPVIYEGFDEVAGHAIVVDGYNDQGLYNINWGWGGYCNGFYDLDRLSPDGSGIGGNSSGGYNLDQGAIFSVRPVTESEKNIDLVEFQTNQSFADGIEVQNMVKPVKKGDSFYVDSGIVKNIGTNTITNDFRLVMTDYEGNVVEEFASTPASPLLPFETQMSLSSMKWITITRDVEAGHRLRVVFKSSISDLWVPVTCDSSVGEWEIILKDGMPEPQPLPDLEELTSLRYDKTGGVLHIKTIKGAEVTFREKESGKDLSGHLRHDDEGFSVSMKALDRGTYVLAVGLGDKKSEIELEF